MINWGDPAVQAAIIQSAGGVLAATIAAVCAAMIGARLADRKRLQEKLQKAMEDIAFLLVVEEEHCNLHMQHVQGSFKYRVRRWARARGMKWSGQFTPGRVQSAEAGAVPLPARSETESQEHKRAA